MDLALNNLQRLICHKTNQTKPKAGWTKRNFIDKVATRNNRNISIITPTPPTPNQPHFIFLYLMYWALLRFSLGDSVGVFLLARHCGAGWLFSSCTNVFSFSSFIDFFSQISTWVIFFDLQIVSSRVFFTPSEL